MRPFALASIVLLALCGAGPGVGAGPSEGVGGTAAASEPRVDPAVDPAGQGGTPARDGATSGDAAGTSGEAAGGTSGEAAGGTSGEAAGGKGEGETDAPTGAEEPLDVATILSQIVDDEGYRETSNCLSVRSYDNVEILDDRHLLFEGKREIWLNRLRHRCPLREDQIMVFERRGPKICETDRVSGRDRHDAGMYFGSCLLGEFEQIDEQQAQALRDAIDQMHRTKHGKSVPAEEES